MPKSSENLRRNFRKPRKRFKPVIEEPYTKKIYENFGKSFRIEVENLWHSSETFGKLRKQFKSAFQCFYDFLKFSEIFGNLRKMTGSDRKCS